MIIIRLKINSLWMYLKKIAMPKTIKKLIKLILKNFSFLLILLTLFYNNDLRAEEKFVGFIDTLDGAASKGDGDNLVEL